MPDRRIHCVTHRQNDEFIDLILVLLVRLAGHHQECLVDGLGF